MKNGTKLLLVLAAIVVITMINQGKKEANAIVTSTAHECVDSQRAYQSGWCQLPCIAYTSSTKSCIQSCPGPSYDGLFTYFVEPFMDCATSYSTQSPGGHFVDKCFIDCIYGSLPTVLICTDSDGKNYNSKGTASNAQGFSIMDECKDSTKLYEYYCDAHNNINFEEYSCACSNGQCTSPYSQFISSKNSYLSGGSLSSLIITGNSWIGA